jgi:hypothetical protein
MLCAVRSDEPFWMILPPAVRRDRMDVLAQMYNQKNREVCREYMQEKNDTFAIAVHSFARDLDLSKFPPDMISNLDCFHP